MRKARLARYKHGLRAESEAHIMAEPKPKDEQRQNDKTPFERFEDLAKKVLQVPKEEVDKLREQEKRERRKKRTE